MRAKLIAVADSKHAKFYKATGLKIKEAIGVLRAQTLGIGHEKQELRTGFYHRTSTPSHFFDPHTEAKNIERQEFSKELVKHMHTLFHQGHYNEVIIIAEPKVLGDIRRNLTTELKNVITKEIPKDLVHSTPEEIEGNVFA